MNGGRFGSLLKDALGPMNALVLAFVIPLTAGAGEIVGKIPVQSAKDAEQTVVYVAKVDEKAFPAPEKLSKISQKGAKFTPAVLPIVKGTVVDVTNDDWITHSVYSTTKDHRFDLGKYERAEAKSITFDKVGAIEVLCAIHAQMSAYILVLQNPFFTKPAADGTFTISGVPEGKYELRVFRPEKKEKKKSVTVPADGQVIAKL
jgi:plastocyanin